MIIENNLIRITIEENQNFTSERVEIKDKDNIIPVLASDDGYSTLCYWTKNERKTKFLSYRKSTKKKLYYQLNDNDFQLDLDYCLEENNIIHIRYKLFNKNPIQLSKLLVNYSILLEKDPDFTWVPHHCPGEDFVIGDHVFRSPVIIYKKNKYTFAFIPDLKTLRNNHPFQSFINFNLKPYDIDKKPQLSYGFGNYKPVKHKLFKHDPLREWYIEPNTDLTFRFYIIIFIDKDIDDILHIINNFFWEKYGKKYINESLNPQILPYEKNVQEGYAAIFERHKVWGDFKISNIDCGGIWFRSWAGKKKKAIEYIKPEYLDDFRKNSTSGMPSIQSKTIDMVNELTYDPEKVKWFDSFTRKRAYIPRTAEIWNNAFFLNVRTGFGLVFFGKLWSNNELIERGTRTLNTILKLSRIRGLFPSVIFPSSPNSEVISTINGLKAFGYTDDFHVVDSCLAMYWALKYYEDLEKNEEILAKCKMLVDLLEKIQQISGEIPTFINFKENNEQVVIRDLLIDSASSGASLMFLTEYYKISRDLKSFSIAKKIAKFIKKKIVPSNKWQDFEPYFSCSQLLLDTYDHYTKSHIMNTLSIYWSAEGFKELFKITNSVDYLKIGEYVLAILSLFQQVWDMPYISINTFGGFGVQNSDAELNDARQALFVRTYMEYYLLTGKKEYMERGIAALRASWVLQLLKDYEDLCPGNIQGIDTIDGIDKGVVYENYGHTGSDFRTPGLAPFNWGVGTAATATAYVKKHFGDLFIDFKEKSIWGIDGILIKQFQFLGEKIKVEYYIIPEKKNFLIKAREAPYYPIEIILNEKSIGIYNKKALEEGFKQYFD
ncbi:MAG: hypothetical protein ACFE9I_01150 [Candidatus Hermodarchaeota archaeon]